MPERPTADAGVRRRRGRRRDEAVEDEEAGAAISAAARQLKAMSLEALYATIRKNQVSTAGSPTLPARASTRTSLRQGARRSANEMMNIRFAAKDRRAALRLNAARSKNPWSRAQDPAGADGASSAPHAPRLLPEAFPEKPMDRLRWRQVKSAAKPTAMPPPRTARHWVERQGSAD